MTPRHFQAWALLRRVTRGSGPGPRAMHWAALASIWAHLAAVLWLAILGTGAATRPDGDVLVVVRVTPVPPGGAVRELEHPPARGIPRAWEPTRALGPSPDPERVTTELREVETVRVARTLAEDALPEAPPRWDAESRHHTGSDRSERTPVTSDRRGPLVARSEGPSEEPARRTIERRPGDDEALSGNRPDGDPGPIVLGGGGGGREGGASGSGASTSGGPLTTGGASGRGHAGWPGGALAVRVVETQGDRRGAPRGPGTHPAERAAARPSSGTPQVPVVGVTEVERAGDRVSTGGQEVAQTVPAIPAAAATCPGARRVEAPGTADPAEELRTALGYGPLDRSRLAPRPAWAGTLLAAGRADSSPQTSLDVPIAWQTALSTRGTALGAWVEDAESLVALRWRSLDLEPHARAVGIAGDVTVRYVVRRDGIVGDTRVVRSSGNALLDGMALRAIPQRLPRLPRELDQDWLHHELTLRYRNPLVGIAPP